MKTKILLLVTWTVLSFSCVQGQGNTNNLNNKNSKNINEESKKEPENCIKNSTLTLPLSSEFEHEEYSTSQECLLNGEDWTCGDGEALRYIPLPSKENIQVILVPMDCGDFSYRYYLLTVKYNRIIGNLYVEGEWFEPGSSKEKMIETTRFEISKDYVISVFTKYENQETKHQYNIDSSGAILKI